MSLIFLPNAGARERHLQRQYKNPLFKTEQREFNEQRLSGARYMDEKEVLEFTEKFHILLSEVAELKPNEGSEILLDLKSRLDESYELCSGLAGEHNSEKEAIVKLVNVIMSSIKQGAQGDAEAEQNLQEEELARLTHYQLLEFTLVADLLRPRSPIAQDQLVPTLLSESENAVSAAFQLFDKEHQELICKQSVQLLENRQADMAEAENRLRLMLQLSSN